MLVKKSLGAYMLQDLRVRPHFLVNDLCTDELVLEVAPINHPFHSVVIAVHLVSTIVITVGVPESPNGFNDGVNIIHHFLSQHF
ncbi:hypothetical protein VIGAN_08212600 [Vigna angularis var. angularis]|uniref:Uncharacterized protein n=1 Tax=Vigna angularis var. angularis TaxID=157739 RepID=A0A0S3SRE6_PHAAN|nr:hypothetical protein VIGAN_08212600 [Vigna angularis var. angularis]